MLLMAYSIAKFKTHHFSFQKALILPILLYFLMALSLLWSIDLNESLQGLSKEIAFLLIPICFLVNQDLSRDEKTKILQYFSYSYFGFTIYYLLKAVIRYIFTKDTSVFFYHELVTFDVNAIHMSVYISVAFFYFYTKINKNLLDKLAIAIMLFFLVLLSSKNIIIVFFLLLFYASFFHLKIKWNAIRLFVLSIAILLLGLGFYGKLKDRFSIELDTNEIQNINNSSLGSVNNVSVKDAWNKDQFNSNDFFAGAALRIYQARIFKEMLNTDNVYLTGYGLNATNKKIKQKRIEHQLYYGYDNFNFHNQYIQFFAELGVFGLLLLLLIVFSNLKNALKAKNFVAISFAILMISLFLTESLLSRQRGIVFFIIMYCIFNSKSKSLINA